ncbi:MAG: hypothetical protein P4N60_14795 [Verrucomicrobiae bacterium]|nr:hypothetical protein [Verrucomicrobiae bacterium]
MNNAPTIAVQKIKMMKASIRCLTFGLLGLIPIIGLPFALAAAWTSGRVRKLEQKFWNPARPQRVLGFVCAAIGTLVWTLVDVFLVFRAIYGNTDS